jgi:hypothetical protein
VHQVKRCYNNALTIDHGNNNQRMHEGAGQGLYITLLYIRASSRLMLPSSCKPRARMHRPNLHEAGSFTGQQVTQHTSNQEPQRPPTRKHNVTDPLVS